MNNLKKLQDDTNNQDKIVSRSLEEKRLELTDDEPKFKNTRGKVDDIDIMVSRRLRDRRIMLGLSQNAIGKIIDVSIQQVQKYEKGTNRISSGKLFTLAQFLRVPITYFYEKCYDKGASPSAFVEDVSIPSEKEIVNLIKAFKLIKDLPKRKKIIELIQAVS